MKLAFIVTVWFLLAIAIGASGTLQQLRPPAPQLIVAGLAAALLAAWRISAAFHAWLQAIGLRALVALHLSRFVGVFFLLLSRRNELPCDFALPAGWGDVAIATLAGVLLICWRGLAPLRAWIGAWNTLGLLDILFVVVSAAKHGMAEPLSMAPLLRLPLSLLPTFLVPLIIASHILVFSRLSAR
jgi:hypothetical protein